MTKMSREPFLLWRGSNEFLNGRPDEMAPWLRKCGRFTPALSSRSPGAGVIIFGLCSFVLLAYVASPMQESEHSALGASWLITVALIGCFASAFNAIQSWRGLRLRAKALTSGLLIEGIVTHAGGRTVTFTGSREEGNGEPTSFYILSVEFEFRSPKGEKLWAKEDAVREDLNDGLSALAVGQPVLVLYHGDRRFVML